MPTQAQSLHTLPPPLQAEHIDAVVVALPNNTVTQIAPLKDALAQLDGIYSGEGPAAGPRVHTCRGWLRAELPRLHAPVRCVLACQRKHAKSTPPTFTLVPIRPSPARRAATPSPLTLATDLASLNNQLALPGDVAQLTQQLQSAAAALDGSAQSLADLNSALTTVKSLVQAMDADTTAIGSALSAYVGSGGPWSNVQSALNAGAPHIAAAAAGVSALQSITGSASTKLAQLGQQIDGTAAERQGVADAVTAAVAAIDGAPNTSGFVAILDSVQPAYAALGPTPSQVRSGAVLSVRAQQSGQATKAWAETGLRWGVTVRLTTVTAACASKCPPGPVWRDVAARHDRPADHRYDKRHQAPDWRRDGAPGQRRGAGADASAASLAAPRHRSPWQVGVHARPGTCRGSYALLRRSIPIPRPCRAAGPHRATFAAAAAATLRARRSAASPPGSTASSSASRQS